MSSCGACMEKCRHFSSPPQDTWLSETAFLAENMHKASGLWLDPPLIAFTIFCTYIVCGFWCWTSIASNLVLHWHLCGSHKEECNTELVQCSFQLPWRSNHVVSMRWPICFQLPPWEWIPINSPLALTGGKSMGAFFSCQVKPCVLASDSQNIFY